jgi:hypothetical protein
MSPAPVAMPPPLPRHPKALHADQDGPGPLLLLHTSATSASTVPATTRPSVKKAPGGFGHAVGEGKSLGGSQSFRGRGDSWNLDLNMTLQQWNDLQGVGTPTAVGGVGSVAGGGEGREAGAVGPSAGALACLGVTCTM